MPADLDDAIALLNTHYLAFQKALEFAERTGHTVPSDTKSWSEILVSLLTGIPGRERQKGSDLADGSDVKAANVWAAIDTPRFNGCAPAGRTSETSRRPNDLSAFDETPYLFLVLWDEKGEELIPRCRVWCVRPREDLEFRRVVGKWYQLREEGEILSDNFQLHPPRNLDTNVIRNSCGNLNYPLLFSAEWDGETFQVVTFDEEVLESGECTPANNSEKTVIPDLAP